MSATASANSVSHAEHHPPVLDARTKRNILISMCTALIAVVASVSSLNVAQQSMAKAFGASQGEILWIINAYTLALAALLLPIGAIGDKWGRKPILLGGLGLFAVASIGAALSQTTEMMIIARAFTGIAAAMVMPVTLSVITSSFPPEERPRAIGIWAGFAGSGGLIGMFFASAMVDKVNWRLAFVLPAALVLVAAVLAFRAVPNSVEGADVPFDIGGSLLSAFAIGGLVLGIHEGPEKGWTSPLTVVGLAIGIAALIGFIVWENRQEFPLLDISAFRDRGLAAGTFTLTVVFAIMFGIFLVLFPFLQAILGWSALHSAVAMLPMAAMMMPMSTIAPQISARIGSRTTMITGVTIFGTGLATLATFASVEGGYLSILPGLMIIGLGMGLTMTPSTAAITETLPDEKQGVASALNDTSREIGGSVGVALLGSILSAGYASAVKPATVGLPADAAHAVEESIFGATEVAKSMGDSGNTMLTAAQHAFVDGWASSMWVGVGMAAAVLVFLIVRGPVSITKLASNRNEVANSIDVGEFDVDLEPVG